jgi:hypothetical protein
MIALGLPFTCQDGKSLWTSKPGIWACSGSNDVFSSPINMECSTDSNGTQYVVVSDTTEASSAWYDTSIRSLDLGKSKTFQ